MKQSIRFFLFKFFLLAGVFLEFFSQEPPLIMGSRVHAYERKPWPLPNCGASCYINSLIQALCVLDPFVELVSRTEIPDINNEKNYFTMFIKLCQMLSGKPSVKGFLENKEQNPVQSTYLLLLQEFVARSTEKIFAKSGSQEDIVEFLYSLLIDPYERFSSRTHMAMGSLFTMRVKETITCPLPPALPVPEHISPDLWRDVRAAWQDYGTKENINGIHEVAYSLGFEKGVKPQNAFKQAVEQLFFSEIDFNPLSDLTNNFVSRCVKRSSLVEAPPIFSFFFTVPRGASCDMAIKIPLKLSVQGIAYVLKSCCVRIGGKDKGHYVACVNTAKGMWWLCDDAYIQQIEVDEKKPYFPSAVIDRRYNIQRDVDRGAYLVFYQQEDIMTIEEEKAFDELDLIHSLHGFSSSLQNLAAVLPKH